MFTQKNKNQFVMAGLLSLSLWVFTAAAAMAATQSDDNNYETHLNKSETAIKGDYTITDMDSENNRGVISSTENPWLAHPNKSGIHRKGAYDYSFLEEGTLVPLTRQEYHYVEPAWYSHPNKSESAIKGDYAHHELREGAVEIQEH